MSQTHTQDIHHGRRGGYTLPAESREQREAREARLLRGWCHCWGVVIVVDWEIGKPCSRCGCTWITEAEYLKRRKRAGLGPTREQVAAVVPRTTTRRVQRVTVRGGVL